MHKVAGNARTRLVLLAALPEAAALDLAIVGAGPVGTSAALRAAELGKSVALIDAPEFSGALLRG